MDLSGPITEYHTDLEKGLTLDDIQRMLSKYGYNEVPERKENKIKKFIKKFWGITPGMLEITVLLEWLTQKYLEMYIIAGLLVFNAVLSFFQEEKANAAVESLKQKLRINARVKRDSQWMVIPARELVPGDVIRVRAGDFVPADTRIAEGRVEADQSALTGESLTIEKKPGDVLFSGSTIKRGESTGIISATGSKTNFGRTVELVEMAKPKLHIEETVSKVVRWLLIMVAVTLSIGVALALFKGVKLTEILPLAAILLVSAIPVALPTMFTISMALGSLELAKKGALVTRLDASEDAATMDVVCVDKTGTLTANKLSIADIINVEKYTREDVILYGSLASQEANQDPIDIAFISAARDSSIPFGSYLTKKFVPFDPSTRKTEASVEKDNKQFWVSKGAIATIFPLCNKNSPEELNRLEEQAKMLSVKGYRMIAVATGTTGDDIELVGVAALSDRIRPDSAKLISELKELGISVKMLTGDALPIAIEVAEEAGLGNNVSRASELKGDKALDTIEKSDGFAEIYPEDKYLVVKSLQKIGHVVGMTGDGVNDAPALKQAEVGIAVSNATDVAKKSASVVLTIEGLEGIVDLVKTGRMIYQRILTWIINKIIRTFKRVVFIVLAYILTGLYVVSTFDMILLLFLSDYVTLSISTDNVTYSSRPESWKINGWLKVSICLGLLMVAESIILLYIGLLFFHLGNDIGRLQTFIFDWLTFSGYFTVMMVRERGHFWKSKPSKTLLLSLVINSIIVVLLSVLGLPELPAVSPVELLSVLAYAFVTCLIVNDYIKVFLVRRFV